MRVLKYSVDVRPGPVSDVLAMVRSACLPGIEGFALPARAINLASARACPSQLPRGRLEISIEEGARQGLKLPIVFRESLCRILDGLHRSLRSLPADDFERLVFKFVGGLEELFKLLPDRLR